MSRLFNLISVNRRAIAISVFLGHRLSQSAFDPGFHLPFRNKDDDWLCLRNGTVPSLLNLGMQGLLSLRRR
ncbi:MAG TPA: hypothetical protein VKY85_15965 [Candidatus Angelobacter sp.]|nr:hypothetical protein [Candidatus Angelobacter sp.]